MSTTDLTPSERIDALIAGIADWRGKTFADLRQTILDAQAGIVENGNGWAARMVVRQDDRGGERGQGEADLHARRAAADPDKLFNDGLDGNARRAIDFFEATSSTSER